MIATPWGYVDPQNRESGRTNIYYITESGVPYWQTLDKYYQNIDCLPAGVNFDPNSSYWGYDFAEFVPLNIAPGDSIQGIDADNIRRFHYLSPDELAWARVKYVRDADGKWTQTGNIDFGREQNMGFTAWLKFVIPFFLSFAGAGLYSYIGDTAFSAVGVSASPAVSAAVGQVAVSTALNGGDIQSAVTNYVASFAGGQTGAFAGSAVDSAAIGRAVSAATTAAILGGDVQAAIVSSLAQTGIKTGVQAVSDYTTQDLSDALSDPAVGGNSFDPSFFGSGGSGATYDPTNYQSTQDAINAYNASLGAGVTYAYHDPVYTPSDTIDMSDTNYGSAPYIPPSNDVTGMPTEGYGTGAGGSGGGNDAGGVNIPPLATESGGGSSGGNWLDSITAAALATIKLVQAAQGISATGSVVKAGTVNGGNVVTGNNNGTVTQRNITTGQSSVVIPPPGVAYQTADGNTVVNNGNGTYSLIKPDGSKITGTYNSGSLTGIGAGASNFFSNPANKPIIYGGLALAALLMLKK